MEAITVREDSCADELNEKIFKEFCNEHPEFMIIVNHVVVVKPNKAKKVSASNTIFVYSSKTEDKKRTFKRSFSLFGVALSMLMEITGLDPDSKKVQMLKFHRKAYCSLLCTGDLSSAYSTDGRCHNDRS